ncbi:hypothetical protein FRC08_012961 [Ceratobasidium sp. 394]|nr:hypothetical protein FRC08_012961 [Ceratobasidium sp. 394]
MGKRKTVTTKAQSTARAGGKNRVNISLNKGDNAGQSGSAVKDAAGDSLMLGSGANGYGATSTTKNGRGNVGNAPVVLRRSSRNHPNAGNNDDDAGQSGPAGWGGSQSSLTNPDPEPAQPPPAQPATLSQREGAASPDSGLGAERGAVSKRKHNPAGLSTPDRLPADKRARPNDVGGTGAVDEDMNDADVPQNRGPDKSAEKGWGLEPMSQDKEGQNHDEDANLSDGPGPATQRRQALNQMLAGWEGSVRQLRDRELKLNLGAAAAAEELAQAEIGSAFVRFTGPGDIFGVIALDVDPNSRGNPRALNEGHRDLLYEELRRPNAKRDWESPLFLSVPSRLISQDLQTKMKAHSATDPQSTPPLLKLIREHEDDEIKLENELWLERENERWLTAEELVERRDRLGDLRSSRE